MAGAGSVSKRNFATFELGDNVYELAGGVIPDIAEIAGVEIGDEPNSEALGALVGKFGKDKVLRDNEPVDIPIDLAAQFVEESGVQQPLNRSLWTPEIEDDSSITIITGAVANWQDRTAMLLVGELEEADENDQTIHVVTGDRIMDTASEVSNFNVQDFVEHFDKYPTESEYARAFIVPDLEYTGAEVIMTEYKTKSGEELAAKFISEYEDIFKIGAGISFARVANAGIQLAAQFRAAARKGALADFDASPQFPEVFIKTDTLPVAKTPEEVATPAKFQSPFTGLRQVALTAKLLHEAKV